MSLRCGAKSQQQQHFESSEVTWTKNNNSVLNIKILYKNESNSTLQLACID